MIPITRKELYLNKIVGNDDYSVPEKPISEEEFFFAEILGEAVQAPEPLTRYQIYLAKIAGRNIEIPYPETRLEYFLARAAGMDVETPTPITREEIFWSNYSAIVDFEVEGVPPLTYKAIEGTLENYRIYGNTAGGESVGDLVTSGEHAGEYKVPVTVEGKNLFDNSKTANILKCYLSVSTLVSSANTRTIFIECKPSTTYTVSKIRGKRFVVGLSDKLPAPGVELQEKVINYDASSITITTGLAAKYLVAYIYNAEQDAPITVDEMIASVQIEKGSTATPYEPYHAPVTTPIYLPEPIKMVGDEAEYIDYGEQKQHRVRVNLSEVNEFSNSITDTANGLYIWVQQGKNNFFVYPARSGIFNITEPTTITTNITITNDNDSIRIKHNGYARDIVIDIVYGLSPGVYSVSFNILNYDNTTIGGVVINNIMVNKGSTALPYEPYITNTDVDVTLPALPTLPGTNVLSVGTAVQPSKVYVKYKGERQ